MFKIFPKYYRNAVNRISEEGFICICTFWTKKEYVSDVITEENKKKVLTIGNLYTLEGMKYVIKNIFLCPNVNYLIFTGNDINNIKDKIKKANFNLKDDIFWNYFDSHSIFVDNYKEINTTIEKLEKKGPWIDNIVEFEDVNENLMKGKLQSEIQGFIVRDSNLYRMWQRALTKIKLFGTYKQNKTKEIISLMSVLTDKIILNENMPAIEIIDKYLPQVLSNTPTEGLTYTYGSRLHAKNQINEVIASLRKNKDNRNGISVTWNAETDYHFEPPCLILIDCKIQENYLYMTAYFRSHDIYKGYCMNIIALQSLQEKIVNSLNEDHDYEADINDKKSNEKEMPEFKIVNNRIEILPRYPITKPESELIKRGYLTVISNSAHVYEQDFEKLEKVNMLDCNLDARGYFIIDLDREEKKISVTLMNNNNEVVKHFKEDDAIKLRDLCQPYVSEISHALYLGCELQRAKECLDSGKEYIQV
jgi:thymidylate synthase